MEGNGPKRVAKGLLCRCFVPIICKYLKVFGVLGEGLKVQGSWLWCAGPPLMAQRDGIAGFGVYPRAPMQFLFWVCDGFWVRDYDILPQRVRIYNY